MTTITINDPIIEKTYSKEELKELILNFINFDLKQNHINLHQISIENLSDKSKNRLENIDNLNFVDF